MRTSQNSKCYKIRKTNNEGSRNIEPISIIIHTIQVIQIIPRLIVNIIEKILIEKSKLRPFLTDIMLVVMQNRAKSHEVFNGGQSSRTEGGKTVAQKWRQCDGPEGRLGDFGKNFVTQFKNNCWN